MYIFVLDICCQHLGNKCQLILYIATWPNCPGPNSPLFQGGQLGPGQLGPGAQLSGAQLSTFWGRIVGPRGPTVRGPTIHFFRMDNWAPDCWALRQKPSNWKYISSNSWQDVSNTIQLTCIPQMLVAYISNMNIKKSMLQNPTPKGHTLTLWCIIHTELYSQNVGSLYSVQNFISKYI